EIKGAEAGEVGREVRAPVVVGGGRLVCPGRVKRNAGVSEGIGETECAQPGTDAADHDVTGGGAAGDETQDHGVMAGSGMTASGQVGETSGGGAGGPDGKADRA